MLQPGPRHLEGTVGPDPQPVDDGVRLMLHKNASRILPFALEPDMNDLSAVVVCTAHCHEQPVDGDQHSCHSLCLLLLSVKKDRAVKFSLLLCEGHI